ncbi:hypothetical protein CALCODRAFT_484822 [Calocera cornea HHB12733]|uniref:EthD domain-containing protein n=1 Tax=Calocera cornea HHB12733 TaxID=1353952 RepID=A0A165EQU9_9BASI|nr:hypothetical protein CALCODRAFT_484822 [Calocera cornea HHB12733]
MPILRGLRATFLLTKKEGITDEEFKNHYLNIHAPMSLELMKRHGVISYTHQYLSASSKAELSSALGGHTPQIPYDAVTTIGFPSLEAFKAFLADPENLGRLREDSKNYAQAGPGTVQIGWGEEWVVIHEGDVVGEA